MIMRHIRFNVLLLIVMGLSSVVHSQVSELDNNSFDATDYLGWDANTLFDLNVEQKGDYQIWMSTNGARRLLIDDGNTGNTMGRIGIGNSLPTNFSPRERVHIFQGTGDNLIRFTNNDMGFDSGFDIGIIDDESTRFAVFAMLR
jgi:hypothetical protein